MSNKNKTKAQLIELLTEKGISAQMSMKKDELLLLLETNNTPDVAQPERRETVDKRASYQGKSNSNGKY